MNKGLDLTNLQKIRENRRFVIELIVFAIVLGLLINLLSSFVVNIFTCEEFQKNFWINLSVGMGVLILMIVSFAILIFCKKQVTEYAEIALNLAIAVDKKNNQVKFLEHPFYEPAKYSNELYNYMGGQLNPDFIAQWPEKKPFPLDEFIPGNPRWEIIADVIEACIILLLRQYGKHSLTHSAMHHAEFRSIANRLAKSNLSITQMPSRIRENLFLKSRGVTRILVPEGSRFSINFFGKLPNSRQYERSISLITPYGDIIFALSKYWTIPGNRTSVELEFPDANSQNTTFLRIPIDIEFSFSPGYRRFNKLESHYLWFKKLVSNAERRMDWGHYLRSKKSVGK